MILNNVKELEMLNLSNLTVGISSGCFDLCHFYHLHYLERCKAQCDFLVVGVDSDELLSFFKAKKSVIPEYHRAAMVAALKCVDAVFIMRNLNQFQEASKYANKVFKNQPTLYGQPIVGIDHAELVVIPDIEELTSTSSIVQHIQERK